MSRCVARSPWLTCGRATPDRGPPVSHPRRILTALMVVAGTIVIVFVGALVWADRDDSQQARRNHDRALRQSEETARSFASRLSGDPRAPLPDASAVGKLAASSDLGRVDVTEASSTVTVTFEVTTPYASPGSYSGSAVSVCYEVRVSASPTKHTSLAPLRCSRLPVVLGSPSAPPSGRCRRGAVAEERGHIPPFCPPPMSPDGNGSGMPPP